jgi:hypothetical protein
MSMLVFYINRAGRNIDKEQLAVLTRAKEELRRIYGRNRPQRHPAQNDTTTIGYAGKAGARSFRKEADNRYQPS